MRYLSTFEMNARGLCFFVYRRAFYQSNRYLDVRWIGYWQCQNEYDSFLNRLIFYSYDIIVTLRDSSPLFEGGFLKRNKRGLKIDEQHRLF